MTLLKRIEELEKLAEKATPIEDAHHLYLRVHDLSDQEESNTDSIYERHAEWCEQMQAAVPALCQALREMAELISRLEKFNRELCEDVGVSTHYPSGEKARAFLEKWEGRGR